LQCSADKSWINTKGVAMESPYSLKEVRRRPRDRKKLVAQITRRAAIVVFDSDGGSLVAGLQIGKAIRQKGFSTTVAPGRHCLL
jgi:hypothetical protein